MSEIWKVERDLCRCCHAEGAFNNLSEPIGQNELKEIYSDMLKECFSINIVPVLGPLCEVTFTICDACVLRLKDAYDFMKQVKKCEEKFKDFYNKNAITVSEDYEISVKEEDSFADTNEDYNVSIKAEHQEFYSDYKGYSDGDNLMSLNCEDLRKSQTHKDRRKIKRPKKNKKEELIKEKNKLKNPVNSKKEVDNEKEDTLEDGAMQKGNDRLIPAKNFTIISNEDGVNVHNCNACKKDYFSKEAFMRHYKVVHLQLRQNYRTCYLCKEKVAKHLKAAHLEEKHGIPAPTCNACGKKFSFPNEVLRHQQYHHMGEKKFRCEECGKCFAYNALLKQHLAMHSTSKDYVCQICDKAFKREKALRMHVRIHLNDRQHVCNICNEAFIQIGSLKHHTVKKHPETI